MSLAAIFDSIQAARVPRKFDIFELYRRDLLVPSGIAEGTIRLSVLDVQPEQPSETLLLLHGFAANSAWWRPQLPGLAQHYRVIIIDARGNGYSEHSEGGNTVSRQVEDAIAVLDQLEITQPVVVAGHSAGGFVATDLALSYPERVRKLILIATPSAFQGSSTIRTAKIFMSFPDFFFRLGQPIYELDPRGQANLLGLKRLFMDSLVDWNGHQKFPQVSQPALIIEGQRDALFPTDMFKKVAEEIPEATLVEIGVSKHQVTLERPKAVLRAMRQFIEPSDSFRAAWRSENDDIESVKLLAARPWIARYEGDMPAELILPRVPLFHILMSAARQYGSRPAIHYKNGRLAQKFNYQELLAETSRFSRVLTRCGLKSGDRVMVLLPNCPQFIIAVFGCLIMGGVAVLADPESSDTDLAARAAQTQARCLVTIDSASGRLEAVQQKLAFDCIITVSENDYDPKMVRERTQARRRSGQAASAAAAAPATENCWHILREEVSAAPLHSSLSPAFTAVTLFTSGAEPKIVSLTHSQLMAASVQSGAWMTLFKQGSGSIQSGVPFSAAYGFMLGICAAIHKAARILIPANVEPETQLELVKTEKPDLILGTPDTYIQLNQLRDVRQYLPSPPPIFISSGARLPVEVEERFQRLSRAPLLEVYGLSETGYVALISPRHRDRTGSVGLPVPNSDVRITDPQTGHALPFGHVGELWIRGPQVMTLAPVSGPKAGKESGWLATGDLAEMDDDGYFRILGRLEDVVFRAGTAIYLRDIEETIYEIPEVREAAVLKRGAKIVAYICLSPEEKIRSADIEIFCRRRLPATHQPDRLEILEKLPRSHTGKLQRNMLSP